jgi:AcrR family transcriptional regulator
MNHPIASQATSPLPESPVGGRRRKDARPSELTAAALALFVDKGFAATRLDDVAARAGVSKGTLYLYFSSKEALFKAVIEDGMVAALAAAEERLAGFQGSAADLLHELLLGWWQQIGRTAMAGVTKLIISESRNFPEVAQYYHERVITRGRALLRHALERGIAGGEFRPVECGSGDRRDHCAAADAGDLTLLAPPVRAAGGAGGLSRNAFRPAAPGPAAAPTRSTTGSRRRTRHAAERDPRRVRRRCSRCHCSPCSLPAARSRHRPSRREGY